MSYPFIAVEGSSSNRRKPILTQPQKLLKGFAASLVCVVLSGCATPFLMFSGRALSGPVQQTGSFAFASDQTLLTLEVRSDAPYSVLLRVVVLDDQLYVDAAPGRRWHHFLQEDQRVRVKLGEVIYPAIAVVETDPLIIDRFLAGRTIYRLVPRELD